MKVHSYGKVYNIGHGAVKELFFDPVVVEEKIDGSQFSFGMYDGELLCRSKNKQIEMDAPNNLFDVAVEVIKVLQGKLHDGWTYRCEYLRKPRHNAIAYGRVPLNHLVLYDIDTGLQNYVSPEVKALWAATLDIEPVPVILCDKVDSASELKELLDRESVLGGSKVEGIVCKNYERYCKDGKQMMGKYVSEEFKEHSKREWAKGNKSSADIKTEIGQAMRSERRWEKAIEHLRDEGSLENDPRDIGQLMHMVHQDVVDEEEGWIKDKLWEWCRKDVCRMAVRGLPEWYKERLLNSQFKEQP